MCVYTYYKISIIHSIGDSRMAKNPTSLCLELNGEDAIQFLRYLADPEDDTPEGKQLMRNAAELAKLNRLEDL